MLEYSCTLHFSQLNKNSCEVDNHDDCYKLFGRTATLLIQNVHCRKSAATGVDAKLRGIKATCIINVDRNDMCKLTCFPSETETLVVASEGAYSSFVCMCLHTQSTTQKHV